jgi:hypothetical protein
MNLQQSKSSPLYTRLPIRLCIIWFRRPIQILVHCLLVKETHPDAITGFEGDWMVVNEIGNAYAN